MRKRILSFFIALSTLILPCAAVLAATTIGNNVSVGGTLSSTGAASFNGGFIAVDTTSTGFAFVSGTVQFGTNSTNQMRTGVINQPTKGVAGVISAPHTSNIIYLMRDIDVTSTPDLSLGTSAGLDSGPVLVFMSAVQAASSSYGYVGMQTIGGVPANLLLAGSSPNGSANGIGFYLAAGWGGPTGSGGDAGDVTFAPGQGGGSGTHRGGDVIIDTSSGVNGARAGAIRPYADNTTNSGILGTAWQNVFADGAFWTASGANNSLLTPTFLTVASSTSNRLGKFYVDSSGNISTSGTLAVNQGASATTTVNIGSLGLSSSKSCVNMQTSVGTQASFYINAAGTIVSELNPCR